MVCLSRIIEFVEIAAAQKLLDFSQSNKNLTYMDYLMFLIAHFISPKSNTISISSDNDFPALRRYISRSQNSFTQDVTNKKTA